jgi:DNA-binding NtrC family response regulator
MPESAPAVEQDVKGKILIIDDEPEIRESLETLLELENYAVVSAPDGKTGLNLLAARAVDLVLLDLMLPDLSGIDVLERIREQDHETPVVVLTAYGSVENAVAAIKCGANDFLTKPWNNDKLLLEIDQTITRSRLERENAQLKSQLRQRYSFSNIIGKSVSMQRVFDLVAQVAPSRSTVLIHGESGTGKELIAKAIHAYSPRVDKPFVAVNTSSIPVDLIESALFGHVRGAFTSAIASRKGYFELASGGTLFLDEIGTLGLDTQAKLLRVIQEREFMPVGSNETVRIDVRIVAATNDDLANLVEEERFRKDLYYRLNVIEIKLPPLRERREDIPLLSEHFLNKYSQENQRFLEGNGRSKLRFAAEALQILLDHDWPGNVRELENVVERAVVLATQPEIPAELLPESLLGPNGFEHPRIPANFKPAAGASLHETVDDFERQVILEALEQCNWSQTEAAKRLNVALSTLNQKIQRLNIDIKKRKGRNQESA